MVWKTFLSTNSHLVALLCHFLLSFLVYSPAIGPGEPRLVKVTPAKALMSLRVSSESRPKPPWDSSVMMNGW